MHRSRPSSGLPIRAQTTQRCKAQDRDLHQQQRLRAEVKLGRHRQAVGYDESCRFVVLDKVRAAPSIGRLVF